MSLMTYLVIAATSWYLLNAMAGILRPLLLALLIGYIILPIYQRLKQYIPGMLAMLTMLLGVGAIFWLVFLIATRSISEFREQLPELQRSFQQKIDSLQEYANGPAKPDAPKEKVPDRSKVEPATAKPFEYVYSKEESETPKLAPPTQESSGTPWLKHVLDEVESVGQDAQKHIGELAQWIVGWAANFLVELFVVFLYLMFMLMESSKFPARVKKAFPAENAERIEMTLHGINVKIANYFMAKTLSSFLLALPVTILLWSFGVQFAVLWGFITFVGNFIPYVGSAISIAAPSLFILLALPWAGGWPLLVIGLLLACHLFGAAIMEPPLLGRAVGLSPVVVLLSLTFWGTCWGFGGMLLAVPLTVMIKIIMENISVSAPVARMLGDE